MLEHVWSTGNETHFVPCVFSQAAETPEECIAKPNPQPSADAPPAVGDNREHDHTRHHGHGHHGHHGHRHQGDQLAFHPRGSGHNHGHHHGNHNGDGHGSDFQQSQQGVRPQPHGFAHGQHDLDLPQLQQAVDTQQLLQEVLAEPVRP